MNGLWVQDGALSLRTDLPDGAVSGEVLLAPVLSGICRTDVELVSGYMQFAGVPGHEFVARVVTGSGKFPPDTLVVGEINCGCGACPDCRHNRSRHCASRTVLGILGRNGCMQERFTLPERNLLAVPAGIPPEAAVFAEPLAAACRIVEQQVVPANAEVAVVGDGKLGSLCALVLDHHGHRVTLYGRHGEARTALFAGSGVRLRSSDDTQAKYPVVVECTGRADGVASSFARLAPLGTLVLKTTTHQPPAFPLAQCVIDEFRVVGSRCGRLDMALDLLAAGVIPVEQMIAARYPLARGHEAFAHASRRGVLKVLLEHRDAARGSR